MPITENQPSLTNLHLNLPSYSKPPGSAPGSQRWRLGKRRERSQEPVKTAGWQLCPPRIHSSSRSITSVDRILVCGPLPASPQRGSLRSSRTSGIRVRDPQKQKL